MDIKPKFFGCDEFGDDMKSLVDKAYDKLHQEPRPRIAEFSMFDLAIVSVVCNRVFRQNTGEGNKSASPFQRIKGVIKHMNGLVMDLQEIIDLATLNFNGQRYSSEASVEHLYQSVSTLVRMLYLSMENLYHVSAEIPERPYTIPDLMALNMELSRKEGNFTVRPKPPKPTGKKKPTIEEET